MKVWVSKHPFCCRTPTKINETPMADLWHRVGGPPWVFHSLFTMGNAQLHSCTTLLKNRLHEIHANISHSMFVGYDVVCIYRRMYLDAPLRSLPSIPQNPHPLSLFLNSASLQDFATAGSVSALSPPPSAIVYCAVPDARVTSRLSYNFLSGTPLSPVSCTSGMWRGHGAHARWRQLDMSAEVRR